jgi:Leucine-rich repeat (LRR) protein/tRNA A-37 threonylcarbamoyl transferase component Bud32
VSCAFDGLTSLRRLTISQNQISDISGVFDGLSSLIFLQLTYNSIAEIQEETFSGLAELEHLSLSNNHISMIEAGSFKDLASLENLFLSNNELETIQNGTFDGLPALERLELQLNMISNISGAFDGLSSLCFLLLNFNSIAEIQEESFSGLVALDHLSLIGNRISVIEAGSFKDLANLTTLLLLSNELETIQASTFEGLPALERLELQRNQISVCADSFKDLTSLTTLLLSYNDLETVQAGTFDRSPALKILDLEFNDISTVAPMSFAELVSLESMFLNNNRLSTLTVDAFGGKGMENLDVLYLFENSMTTIQAGSFSGLKGLKELRLDSNLLLDLSVAALEGLSSENLRNIYLPNNLLENTRLDVDLFLRFENLELLNLVGNTNLECFHFNFPNFPDCDSDSVAPDLQQVIGAGDDIMMQSPALLEYYREGAPGALLDGLIGTALTLGEERRDDVDSRPMINDVDHGYIFTITPRNGPVVVSGLQFTKGGRGNVDPDRFILEGANASADGDYTFEELGRQSIEPYSSLYQATPVIRFANTESHATFRLSLLWDPADAEQIPLGELAVSISEATFWGPRTDAPQQDSLVWLYATLAALGCALILAGLAVMRRFRSSDGDEDDQYYRKLEGGGLDTIIPNQYCIPPTSLKIGKTLGLGASGIVSEGFFGKCPVAIKQFPRGGMMQDEDARLGIESERRECEVLAKLQHPWCVAFYGYSEDRSNFMIVQELCSGGDLRLALIKHPDVVLQRSQDFVLQIASAFEYLHSQSIIHRDIKAENVLLSEPDIQRASIKICDFGLSKNLVDHTQLTITGGHGTARYMAPELAAKMLDEDNQFIHTIDGKKCDVYATGVLFSELSQPHSPIMETRRQLAFLTAVVDEEFRPDLTEAVPPHSAALIRMMWKTDAHSRPSFSEVLAALEEGPPVSDVNPHPRPTSIEVLVDVDFPGNGH